MTVTVTQEEFSAIQGLAGKWPTRRGLLRNLAVARDNWDVLEAVPALAVALNDEEPLVREHAVWARGAVSERKPGGRRCGGGNTGRGGRVVREKMATPIQSRSSSRALPKEISQIVLDWLNALGTSIAKCCSDVHLIEDQALRPQLYAV